MDLDEGIPLKSNRKLRVLIWSLKSWGLKFTITKKMEEIKSIPTNNNNNRITTRRKQWQGKLWGGKSRVACSHRADLNILYDTFVVCFDSLCCAGSLCYDWPTLPYGSHVRVRATPPQLSTKSYAACNSEIQ
jgi:hypothetical protein